MKNPLSYIEIKPTKLNYGVIFVLILFISLIILTFVLKFQNDTNQNDTVVENDRCIITIDGEQYDVTNFIPMHPGGDVYRCGEDMSEEFHQQHDKRVLVNVEKL
jgi:hypothetical protein